MDLRRTLIAGVAALGFGAVCSPRHTSLCWSPLARTNGLYKRPSASPAKQASNTKSNRAHSAASVAPAKLAPLTNNNALT